MYRIVTGAEVRSINFFNLNLINTNSEVQNRIKLYKNTIYKNFSELTRPGMRLPRDSVSYVFEIAMDCKSGMPVVIGCDDFEFYKRDGWYTNVIKTIPNTVIGSPVLENVAEIVEWCKHLRKRYYEILKEIKASEVEDKITDIKNASEKWET